MNPIPEMVDSKSKIAATERVDVFLKRRQTWIVGAMCCFALVRILIFAAAFPLFNNVDEQDHYEMVYRYATNGACVYIVWLARIFRFQ
jgi:hypothetical protein